MTLPQVLRCAALCYAVPCCAALCCTALAAPHCVVPRRALPCHAAPCRAAACHAVPCCAALHRAVAQQGRAGRTAGCTPFATTSLRPACKLGRCLCLADLADDDSEEGVAAVLSTIRPASGGAGEDTSSTDEEVAATPSGEGEERGAGFNTCFGKPLLQARLRRWQQAHW